MQATANYIEIPSQKDIEAYPRHLATAHHHWYTGVTAVLLICCCSSHLPPLQAQMQVLPGQMLQMQQALLAQLQIHCPLC